MHLYLYYYVWFSFNRSIFQKLFQVRPGPMGFIKKNLWRTFVVYLYLLFIFYIFFFQNLFSFFSGQLLVILSVSVRLTLYCVTLTFILFTDLSIEVVIRFI